MVRGRSESVPVHGCVRLPPMCKMHHRSRILVESYGVFPFVLYLRTNVGRQDVFHLRPFEDFPVGHGNTDDLSIGNPDLRFRISGSSGP